MAVKKTDEQRLKELQAKISKRSEVAAAKKVIADAQDKLRKLRGKK